MKLKNQVCSLELAKKLKELRAEQESVWYYDSTGRLVLEHAIEHCHDDVGISNNEYSAFTVAELYKLHFQKFGQCYVRKNISPDYLADYLAESYINILVKGGEK